MNSAPAVQELGPAILNIAEASGNTKPVTCAGSASSRSAAVTSAGNAASHADDFAEIQMVPSYFFCSASDGRVSSSLLETSYQPGLLSVDMRDVLPDHIAQPLRQGLRDFGQKMRGYLSNEGQLIGIESRTSSPVRIPRDRDTCEHLTTRRLFPCGEGAGYAGGIVSAAMDGERCANELASLYK